MSLVDPVMKVVSLGLDQARWLEGEAERSGIAEAELIRQAIERMMADPLAEDWEQQFDLWFDAEYLERGVRLPPGEDVLKRVRLEQRQAIWLDTRRLGHSHRERLRQALERLQSGPPAKLPSDLRSLWKRRDWLYTVGASVSQALRWERYRARQRDS